MRKGWEIKKLGEVCYFEGGSQPPKKDFEYTYRDGLIRLIQIRDYKTDNHIVYIPKEKAKRFCNEHEIMIGRYGPPVFQILRGIKGAYNVALMKAIPNEKIIAREFMFWFLQHPGIQRYIIKLSERAVGQTGISKDDLEAYPIFYPNINEQQHIVAILEEAFEAIDQAKVNTEKNLQNAKEMFQSELNSIFTNKGEGWVEKKLNEVCEVKDGTHDSPRYIPDGIPFVTQKNIRLEGLSFENTRFITQTDHEKFYKRSNVAFGDILISMIGANRGMACIVDDERIFSIKNVGLVKANKNINQNYLLYFLKSQRAVSYVKSFSKGGAQEFIGLTELRSFPIPIAPANDQQRIVNQLNTLSAETKQLEENYRKKLESLEELKKSILQKAFSGELTRQTTEIEMEQLDLVAEDQAKYQS